MAWLCDSRVRVVIIAPFSFHDNTLYKLGIFFRGRFVSLSYGVDCMISAVVSRGGTGVWARTILNDSAYHIRNVSLFSQQE